MVSDSGRTFSVQFLSSSPEKANADSTHSIVGSKLILIAVMLRGRHRGLPVALDRAVRLPGRNGIVGAGEEEDRVRRRSISTTFRGRDE